MKTKRIIPCLDMTEGKVVKGIQFKSFRDAGDPVEMAKKYSESGADELVFLDITATVENRPILLDVVRNTAINVSIPFSVGGGTRSVEDVRQLLLAGADKVSMNTGAVKNPTLISDAARQFGNQCVVLSLDAKKVASGQWNVFIKDGTVDSGLDAVEWVKQATSLGAGEILLTSIDQDGTKRGFDIELTRVVSNAVTVPVIASGGAGKMEDFVDIFTKGNADAALAASLFHFGELTINELKRYLEANKILIRKTYEQ
ncbi:MAG: imidazole glycerol phosphate synthase subunit HisF [Patescibacteria group bacterium]